MPIIFTQKYHVIATNIFPTLALWSLIFDRDPHWMFKKFSSKASSKYHLS